MHCFSHKLIQCQNVKSPAVPERNIILEKAKHHQKHTASLVCAYILNCRYLTAKQEGEEI